MPDIKLSDGKTISFSKETNGLEIAKKISTSLAKEACVISVDGELKDLSFIINKDAQVKIITAKDKEGLEVIRHDAAHILAMSVQELFPGTQVTIGPVIEDGFYYDFSRKEPFTDSDLKKIEKKMREIVDRNDLTKREVWKRVLREDLICKSDPYRDCLFLSKVIFYLISIADSIFSSIHLTTVLLRIFVPVSLLFPGFPGFVWHHRFHFQ